MKEEKFSIFIPLEIEKSNDGEDRYANMKFKGIASNPNEGYDKQGQWLDPRGFDLNDFIKSGTFNWHHRWKDKPTAIVGEPTRAEVTKSGELYVEGTLYKSSQVARDIYDLAEVLQTDSPNRRIGMSIEGIPTMVDPKNKNRILKARLTNIALTPAPICPGTSMELMKGGIDELQFETKEDLLIDVTDEHGVRWTVDSNLTLHKGEESEFEKADPREGKMFTKKQLGKFGEAIGKKGEGSRGGVIIGHTKSGKPIYADKSAGSYKGFTKQDHKHAHELHVQKSIQHHKLGLTSKDQKAYHSDAEEKHSLLADNHLEEYDSFKRIHYAIKDKKTGHNLYSTAGHGEEFEGSEDEAVKHAIKQFNSNAKDWGKGKFDSKQHEVQVEFKKAMEAGSVTGTETTNQSLTQAPLKEESMEGSKGKKKKKAMIKDVTELNKSEIENYLVEEFELDKASAERVVQLAEAIEKGGEGSKGGKIIGHTKSGKAIYADSLHIGAQTWIAGKFDDGGEKKVKQTRKNFSKEDHEDAAALHQAESDRHLKEGKDIVARDGEKKAHKDGEATQHAFQSAHHKKMADEHRKAGKEKAGIIGETKSGKEIHDNPFHDSHKNFSAQDHRDASNLHHSLRGHKDQAIAHGKIAYDKDKVGDSKSISKAEVLTTLLEEHNLDSESAKRVWELTKAIDMSRLVQKQVQVKGPHGTFMATRWVDPKTGMSVAGHEKQSANVADVSDDKMASQVSQIIHSESLGKVAKVRDLIGLGIYDKKVLSLLVDNSAAIVYSELKNLGITGERASTPVNTGAEVIEGDGEAGSSTPAAEQDLSELSSKKLKRILDDRRAKKREESGLTYKDFWNSYESTLKGVIIDGYPKSLIAYGTGGLGKTYTLDTVMEQLQVRKFDPEINPTRDQYDAVVIKGSTGLRDMWQIIVENKDKLIIFDDCDSMWRGDDNPAQNILKGMLDTSGDGSVRYGNASKDADGNPLPKQIRFTGQVVFISNLQREDFPQPLISSRCGAIDLTMTKDETMDKLNDIKGSIKIRGKNDVPVEISQESRTAAYDFFKRHKNSLDLGQINGRTFAQVAQIHNRLTKENNKGQFENEALIRMNLV